MLVRYCPGCGTSYTLEEAARRPRFCSECGEALQHAEPAETAALATAVVTHPPAPEAPAPHVPAPRALERVAAAKAKERWRTVEPEHAVVEEPEPPPLVLPGSPELMPAPPAALEAPIEPPPEGAILPARRSNYWHDWAGFLTSTVVHTAAFIILSLIIIVPDEDTWLEIVSAPQVVEELAIEKIEPVDVELEIEAVAKDITDHEMLEAQVEDTELEAPDDLAGEGDFETAGRITLPEGLFASVPGGGRGGALAMSAPEFAKRLTKAGAKSGAVQMSLIWNNRNDLDLHVITPSGQRIYFRDRRSRCRGELDVDMNAEGPITDEPVENIYWPAQRAPMGEYVVIVHHYANHGEPDPTPFEVLVQVDGRVEKFHGKLTHLEPEQVIYRFERKPGDDFYVE